MDRVAGACPNLQEYHDYSFCHPTRRGIHGISGAAILPTAPARLTHDAFSVGRIKQTAAICDALVFLEITTPMCHWEVELPVLQVSLPNLVSLKIEQRGAMLNIMLKCSMPMLQRLCFAPLKYKIDVGRDTAAFLRKHGQRLTQLECPGLLWGIGGVEPGLDALCPALKELAVDPLQHLSGGLRPDPPPINGRPGHQGVCEIGFRNIASIVGLAPAGSTGLHPKIASLINTEAFPKLKSVRDMAWNPNARRVEGGWGAISSACADRGVVFRDWAGRVID